MQWKQKKAHCQSLPTITLSNEDFIGNDKTRDDPMADTTTKKSI